MGSVILANRYNDVWDKATITEIHSHELVEEVIHNSNFTSINDRLEVMNFRHNVCYNPINQRILIYGINSVSSTIIKSKGRT